MYRLAVEYLRDWRLRDGRMPLVVRGARQVGKSYLVRMFAEEHFDHFVEINLEEQPQLAELLLADTPQEALARLELFFDCDIVPGKTLLFLDEIQAAPELFARLRYFHERIPDLHVVAAGSLLEFVLQDHHFSMPVGRVEYLHLGPMKFSEFLRALGKTRLAASLRDFSLEDSIPPPIHQELLKLFRLFLVVGGMPKSVQTYVDSRSLRQCDIIKQSILSTYVDDFHKYGQRVNHSRVQRVFRAIPMSVGRKFRYVNVSREERSTAIAAALRLLELARVCHLVNHTAAQGIPLGAQTKETTFKVLFLDVGLLLSVCGIDALEVTEAEDLLLVNRGAVCEQFIGQHLQYRQEPYRDPELFYWTRQKPSSNAEIDYVVSVGSQIVPVEVKAGKTGSLRSLHQFVVQRELPLGVRICQDVPSLVFAKGQLPTKEAYGYDLMSLPLYLIEELERLVRLWRGRSST
jgi:uncharacterized protein